MPNYENPKNVAEWLLGFDTKIQPELPNQIEVHYTNAYKPKVFLTYITDRSKTDVFSVVSRLISDAATYYRNRYNIDQFVIDMSLDPHEQKISTILDAWNEAKSLFEYFTDQDSASLYPSDVTTIVDTLKRDNDTVKTHYDQLSRERIEAFAKENPPLPDGFVTLESLKANLDTGLIGDQIGNYGESDIYDNLAALTDNNVDIYTSELISWLNDNLYTAFDYIDEVTTEHNYKDDDPFPRILQAAQFEFYRDDLESHFDDVMSFYTLNQLIESGIYAVREDVDLFDLIRIDSTDSMDTGVDNFKNELRSLVETAFAENENVNKYAAYDMADECVDEDFDFVNPYVLTVRTAQLINDKGYDTAFKEDWAYILEDQSYDA